MKKAMCIVLGVFLLAGCGGAGASEKSKGFAEVETPASELDQLCSDMGKDGIPCAVGVGESNDEMMARTISEDEGRKGIAVSMGTLINRLSDQYAQNVGSEAKKLYEEKFNQITSQKISGARSHKTKTLYNEETGVYKIYNLMIMDPDIFKQMMEDAAAAQEEMELRVKSAEMQQRMDDAIKAYQERYSN